MTLTVDFENRAIRGVTIIGRGPTKDGRFDFGDAQLQKLGEILSAKPDGFKSRFGHHPSGSAESSVATAAKILNIRREENRIAGDVEFYESAALSPLFQRDPVPALLSQAKEAPGSFGLSIDFSYATENENASAPGSDFEPMDVETIDLVGSPAGSQHGLLAQEDNMKTVHKATLAGDPAPAPAAPATPPPASEPDPNAPVKTDSEALMERFLALKGAFEFDLEFACRMFIEGKTLEQALEEKKVLDEERAKAALAKRVKDLEAQLSEAQKRPALGAQAATLSVQEGETEPSSAKPETFHDAVLSIMTEKKVDRRTAAQLALKNHPELADHKNK